MQENNYDVYATFRQAGGPHTLTVPHKRHVKIHPPHAASVEEVTTTTTTVQTPAPPNQK